MEAVKGAALGMPVFCYGKVSSSAYTLDAKLTPGVSVGIEDFQTMTLQRVGERIFIGGAFRERCSQTTTAALVEITNGSPQTVWRDSSLFSSQLRSVTFDTSGASLLIARERPVGVRTVRPAAVMDSKRWGDGGDTLWEYSMVKLDPAMKQLSRSDSSHGLSAYPQGAVATSRGAVIFGTLGGRPAMSPLQ